MLKIATFAKPQNGNISGYELITEEAVKSSSTNIAPINAIILITRVSVGKFAWCDSEYAINQDLTALVPQEHVVNKYLFYYASVLSENIQANAQGIGVRGVTRDFVADLILPLPLKETQRKIVDKIDLERNVINGCRELIKVYEAKIKAVVDRVWGE